MSPNFIASPAEGQKNKKAQLSSPENLKRPGAAKGDNRRQNEQNLNNQEQDREQGGKKTPSSNVKIETSTTQPVHKGKSSAEQTPKGVYSKEQPPKTNKDQLRQESINQSDDKAENVNDKFRDAIQIARDSIFQRMENIDRVLNKEDSSTPKDREKSGRTGKSEKSEASTSQQRSIAKQRPGDINVSNNQAKQPSYSPAKPTTDQLRSPITAKTDLSTATSLHSSNLVPRGRKDNTTLGKGLESSQVDTAKSILFKEQTPKTEESPEKFEAVEYPPRQSYQGLRKKNRYSKDRASLNQPANLVPSTKGGYSDIKSEKNSKIIGQTQYGAETKAQVVQRFDLSRNRTRNAQQNENSRSKVSQVEFAT